jgi:acetylornithine/LysW-gamma-L-lysine aminotransferase
MNDFKKTEDNYGLNLFQKREIALLRGKDARVWDESGKEYIDCTSGHGVASIGHANQKIVDALADQAARIITCTGSFYNDKRAALMEKLVSISPQNLKRVFLCNSGTESIEAALKFARISTGKTDFICAMRSFHGRTMGALSATYNPKYREDFKPLVPGFHFVPFNNFEKLQEKVNKNTAGILLEIVQGEGGVYPADEMYLKQVEALCRKLKIMFIIDEVQTGFARTGRLFACNHFDLQPDILCLSKAIAGGFPLGAALCSEAIEVSLGKHGTTFGGNPLACAASLAAIDFILENDLAGEAKKKGQYFIEKMGRHSLPRIREIRQIGLMIGIELREKGQVFINRLQDEGVLVLPAGATVIRLLPPLIISYEELDIVIDKLTNVLSE